jgi:hypothetical protein
MTKTSVGIIDPDFEDDHFTKLKTYDGIGNFGGAIAVRRLQKSTST